MSLKNKEKFAEKWEKTRRKGKLKYVLYSISKFIIGFWVIAIIFNLIEGNRFIQVIEYWPVVFPHIEDDGLFYLINLQIKPQGLDVLQMTF